MRKASKVIQKRAEKNVVSEVSDEATHTLEKSLETVKFRETDGAVRYAVRVKPKTVNQKKVVNGKPVRVGLYGAVLEYGKQNQPPKSWLRRAALEGKQDALTTAQQEFRTGLDQAVQEARNEAGRF